MKRKLISILLICSLIFTSQFAAVFATTDTSADETEENLVWEDGDITFTLDPEGTLTVTGEGPTLDYYWWRDEYSPVQGNERIKKVIVEEGITRLGNELFDKCTKIEEVIFPSTLTSLGDQTFSGCERLQSVEIPNHVTDFGYLVFDDCRGMKEFVVAENHPTLSVDENGVLFNKEKTVLLDYPGGKTDTSYDVPEGVREIYHYAFDECKNLQTVNLPSSLRIIGDEAFFECTGLTNIDVPEGVERICGGTFQQCENLVDISLPESLKYVNGLAFRDTGYYHDLDNWEDNYVLYIDTILVEGKYLDEDYNTYEPTGELVIKEGTTLIAGETLDFNWDITSINFPDSLKHICFAAFYGCRGLVEIDLPKGLETLDDLAFNSCTNLSQVTMGSRLTYVGYDVFEDTIYQDNENNYTDGILYNNGNLIVTGDTITSECSIKDDTRLIAAQAFEGKTNLTTLHIPESVKYVNAGAFSACDNLNEVKIPVTVETIGDKAFGYDYYYDWNKDEEVFSKYNDFTIKGYLDTEAQRYAVDNDIPFVNLADDGEEEGDMPDQPGTCNHKNEAPFPYVPATCTEQGYQGGCYCVDCGETLIERDVLEPKGHFESTILEVLPTCTEPGWTEGIECSVCHDVLEAPEVWPAYGHYKHEKIKGYDATCTEPGLTDGWKCECGEIHTPQETIPAGCKLETKMESQATTAVDGKLVTKCTVCGKVDSEEVIGRAVVSLSQNSFTYDGQEKTPEVIVKDRFGNEISTDNYRVTESSGRVNVGQYTYSVELKNQYVGYVVLTMKINPTGTAIEQVWSDSTSVTAMVQQVAADNANITGYEVRCSSTEDFSKDVKTVQTNSTYEPYQTFHNLQPNTKYYVQVRTYKKIAGENYYSQWSDTVHKATTEENIYDPPVCEHVFSDTFTVDQKASPTKDGIKSKHCINDDCDERTEVVTIPKMSQMTLGTTSYVYNSSAKKPTVTVKDSQKHTLKKDTDYKISYKNNVNAGTATVTITGIGNYEGTMSKTFTIKKGTMTGIKATGKTTTYNGKAHTVTLSGVPSGAKVYYKTSSSGTYSTTKPTRTSAGTTTVYYKVTKSNYNDVTGSVKIVVKPRSISTASLSTTSYVYNGYAKKPTATVKNSSDTKLTKNTHYTVSYKNNTNVGKATVTIKGKGNYTGTITKTFKINPKATKITSLTKGSKSFTVKWSKVTTQTSGYQIYYTTSTTRTNGKTYTVTSNKTTSKTFTGLKSKKKYYVWVRTYKTVNGTKYYSAWSARNYITTK